MAASYTTREASYLLRARNLRAAQAALSATPQLALDDDAPADAPMGNPVNSAGDERKLYKAQSPLELHRKEFMNRRRLMGESTAWSAELWPLIRRSFNELPPVHQARLQDESKLTASIAAENRRQRRVLVQQQEQPAAQPVDLQRRQSCWSIRDSSGICQRLAF